jgi:pimeloyl-ACP methyl ester carboxylesterase
MLHGLSDSWLSFSRVMPLFPPDLRIVAPDLRGHGDSERPPLGYRITDFAADVVQLMEVLNIPQAVLVGHSMGSFVVRKVYALAPERVSRLVLAGAGASAQTQVFLELSMAVNDLTDPLDELFVRDFQVSCISGGVPDAFMDAMIANSRRMPARVWKAALLGMIEDEVRLARPEVRTLVLGGREDRIFSCAEQMALARQFPRGELQQIDGVGHTLHWEQPATFVNALLRFGV